MERQLAGRCQSCGAREPVLRAVYDWHRTQKDGAWLWVGTARALCSACFADPRLRARWIDERQKQMPAKPMWAKDEPEEFSSARAPTPPAATTRGSESSVPARSSAATARSGKRKSPSRPARKTR